MRFVNTGAGYAVNGNLDLQPESSQNFMGGAEWTASRTYLRLQAFHNRFVDFIEARAVSAPGEPTVFQYANVDNGSTRGLDLEGGLVLHGVRTEGSVSLLTTRDDATGNELLGRPQVSARATLSLPAVFGVRISTTGVFTGRTPMERDTTSGQITSWRDAFPRLDLRLARRIGALTGAPEIVFGADNAFDTQPTQWAGFNRRQLYASLSWTFHHTPAR